MEHIAGSILSFSDQVEVEFIKLFNSFDMGSVPDRKRADVIDSFWSDIYKKVFKPSIDDIRINNCKSKLKTYDVEEVEAVTEIYIKLCKRYGGVIKYNQFCNLTGINRYTIDLWHKANKGNGLYINLSNTDIEAEFNNLYIINYGNDNIEYYDNKTALNIYYNGNAKGVNNSILSSRRFDVKKKLQMEMQDSNTNGLSNDTMGHAIRANNEEELGKLYEPKRMLQHETIRQTLSLEDIKGKLAELSQNKAQLSADNPGLLEQKDG